MRVLLGWLVVFALFGLAGLFQGNWTQRLRDERSALRSPGAGVRKAKLLLGGALFSGTIALIVLVVFGDETDWHAGEMFGLPPLLNVSLFMSVMTIGVGFLSGRGGFWFGAGGFLCYFVLSPLLGQFADSGVVELVDTPSQMLGTLYRPLGIGMLEKQSG